MDLLYERSFPEKSFVEVLSALTPWIPLESLNNDNKNVYYLSSYWMTQIFIIPWTGPNKSIDH